MFVLNGFCFSIFYGTVAIYIHRVSNYAYGPCGAQEDPVLYLCAVPLSWLVEYVLNISCAFDWIIKEEFNLINVFQNLTLPAGAAVKSSGKPSQ